MVRTKTCKQTAKYQTNTIPYSVTFLKVNNRDVKIYNEMFYLNSTINFETPPVLVFQLEVYNKLDRLLTGLTAQLKGTPARCAFRDTAQ